MMLRKPRRRAQAPDGLNHLWDSDIRFTEDVDAANRPGLGLTHPIPFVGTLPESQLLPPIPP